MLRIVNRYLVIAITICFMFSCINNSYALDMNNTVYSSNMKESRKIALTFDDGPHPRHTPKILDILDKYQIKATFFVIGVNVKNYPETLSMVAEKGHEIGNHTYSHRLLKAKTKNEILKEVIDTEKEISKKSGVSTSLIRPPCGLYDEKLLEVAAENQYKIVLWNIDTNDWSHASSEHIVSNVINNVKGGDIILFHDYISGENNTHESLQIIIPKLLMLGYEFVTVSELLQNV